VASWSGTRCRGQANLEVVKANVAVLEQQIRFEVEQAFSN
jgi:hypothetical protein